MATEEKQKGRRSCVAPFSRDRARVVVSSLCIDIFCLSVCKVRCVFTHYVYEPWFLILAILSLQPRKSLLFD